ncbi:MAG: hypothetical protein DRQ88_00850 [Epsilonproteobacteria bacterium]|nr:MAG: hypothetical protein DRQ89_11035 [Campylobacterota bacterium]RLA68183.1 MAG: hypothetical protein DRQ88_00850 [Campylobacterota bacterium]
MKKISLILIFLSSVSFVVVPDGGFSKDRSCFVLKQPVSAAYSTKYCVGDNVQVQGQGAGVIRGFNVQFNTVMANIRFTNGATSAHALNLVKVALGGRTQNR